MLTSYYPRWSKFWLIKSWSNSRDMHLWRWKPIAVATGQVFFLSARSHSVHSKSWALSRPYQTWITIVVHNIVVDPCSVIFAFSLLFHFPLASSNASLARSASWISKFYHSSKQRVTTEVQAALPFSLSPRSMTQIRSIVRISDLLVKCSYREFGQQF